MFCGSGGKKSLRKISLITVLGLLTTNVKRLQGSQCFAYHLTHILVAYLPRKTFYKILKRQAGGIHKIVKRFFWADARILACVMAVANFPLIRFELGCKNPPFLDKSTNSGAKAPVLFGLVWFCGAKPICFSGGRVAIRARVGALFYFLK